MELTLFLRNGYGLTALLSFLLFLGALCSGCSSLSLSEMQSPRTTGKGDVAVRAGIDYGPSLALFYDEPETRVHRVPRAAVFPPVRAGVVYGITDHLDVGANVWSAGWWSALFLLASWDVGGSIHCKYMVTSPASRHGLAFGFSGFAYSGFFAWGQENPVEVSVEGNASGFNPLLLYGFRLTDRALDAPEIYTGLRAYFIDYHVEGTIEHFRSDPPPAYEEYDGSARLFSPVLGLRLPEKEMTFFIETGAFFGSSPLANGSDLGNFTISFGIEK